MTGGSTCDSQLYSVQNLAAVPKDHLVCWIGLSRGCACVGEVVLLNYVAVICNRYSMRPSVL